MNNKVLIILIIVFIVVLILLHSTDIEHWRDLSFIGSKDIQHYTHPHKKYNFSRKNLPMYYPIGTPLDDEYNTYINSLTSPKLSYLRMILLKVQTLTNQDKPPIIFNYSERPVIINKIDIAKFNVLADTIIQLINSNAKPLMNVEKITIENPIHESTDTQSRMIFNLKLKMFYNDINTLSSKNKYDIIFIQPEFIFENISNEEANFFKTYSDQKIDFKTYLSKIIVIGSENMGFLPGLKKD